MYTKIAFFRHLLTFALLVLSLLFGTAFAEVVSFTSTKSSKLTEAVLTSPSSAVSKNAPAVVILHHGGGCVHSQTPQYAKALSSAGYYTLEPCLFYNAQARERSTVVYLPQVFGALRYLASLDGVDKNRIAIIGGSYGAALAFVSATEWAYKNHADQSLPPFAAHAPFYPGCYIYDRFIKARKGRSDLPGDAYDKFVGAKVRIYTGDSDDYDSRDPKACEMMIDLLSPEAKALVSLKVFVGATHGWDHPLGSSFFEPLACKGRGCQNTNESRPDITQQGIVDLIEFLAKAMPSNR